MVAAPVTRAAEDWLTILENWKFLLLALLWIKVRERPSTHEPIQLPQSTQVEVRDAGGLTIAA